MNRHKSKCLPRRPARFRTWFERLEDRVMLATFTWISPTSNIWASSVNWSVSGGTDVDGIPDADDDVTIDPATEVTVTISTTSAARSLSIPGDDHLEITAGSLTLSQPSSASSVLLKGGTLTANGGLTLTGTSSLDAPGVMTGVFRNEGTLTIVDDPGVISTLTLRNATLDNAGTITAGDTLRFDDATLNNLAGSFYDVNVATTKVWQGFRTLDQFNNSGTVRVFGGGATPGVKFNNAANGVIDLQNGGLTLSGGGTSAGGTFNTAAFGQLFFTSTHVLTGTYTGSGGGLVQLENGGTLQIGAAGATFDFPQGLFMWEDGDITGGPLTNAATGHIKILGTTPKLIGVLNNAGTITQEGGQLYFDEGTLNNLAGGVFDIRSSGANLWIRSGAVADFNNSGTLRKSVDAGAATLSGVQVNNAPGGTMDVQTGTLELTGGGNSTGGDFSASAGATLDFDGSAVQTFGGTYTGSAAWIFTTRRAGELKCKRGSSRSAPAAQATAATSPRRRARRSTSTAIHQ